MLLNKNQGIKVLFFQITFLLIVSIQSFSQQRKNEEMPKIAGSLKSINNLTGWAKNDIGKWYEFNLFRLGRQVLKIDIVKISYDGKEYLCVARFNKSFYIRANVKHIEYFTDFWVLDTNEIQDLKYADTSVYTKVYKNIVVSFVLGYQNVTWDDILIQMKRCFIGSELCRTIYESFFVKYRYDYKLNKAQFCLGSLVDYRKDNSGKYDDFSEASIVNCFDNDNNMNLNCYYFEVPKSVFDNNFQSILK